MDQRHCHGSMDNMGNSKAIVWKDFQQAHVLEGHTASVWAVLAIEDDLILTGLFFSLYTCGVCSTQPTCK